MVLPKAGTGIVVFYIRQRNGLRVDRKNPDCARNFLNDLAIRVGVGAIELTHVVAIQHVDRAVFPGSDHQMRMSRCACGIRQQNWTGGSNIQIRRVQLRLVERREVIQNGEIACRG